MVKTVEIQKSKKMQPSPDNMQGYKSEEEHQGIGDEEQARTDENRHLSSHINSI